MNFPLMKNWPRLVAAVVLSGTAFVAAAHGDVTPQAVNHWLYQHAWIVTGARFGWSGVADALRTLGAVDARVQELWSIGGRSGRLARTALADVEARSR